MKNSKKQIFLLSLLASSNLFASDYGTNNLTITNKYILEALFQNGKNKDPKKEEKKEEKSTTSSGDPIYNLFYLSKAIATNTNTLEALGYLNYLAQNSTVDQEFIEGLRSKLIVKDELKEEIKVQLVDIINKENYNDTEIIYPKYGGKIEFKKDELTNIVGLNSVIKAFRSIDIVEYLNSYYSENKDYLNYKEPINKFNKVAVENIDNFTNASVVSLVKPAKLDTIYLAIKNVDNKIKSKKGNNTDENFIILTDEGFKKLNHLKGTFFQECLKNEKFSLNDYVIFLNEYNIFYQKLKNHRESLIDDLLKIKIDSYLKVQGNASNVFSFDQKQINSKIKESRTVIQETNNEISGFKVPSQSDLINSVAQFMANRAKQETMIWFVQYLQKEIQTPLLWDVFPETKEMLETFDIERIKDLNENWRTSLSSDFVKMPTNLINSQWLANQAVKHGRMDELEKIQSSVKSVTYFQKLVSERNNYRSILKHFYELSNDSELFKNQKNLKDITTMLYIVSNEFYTIQDKKMYYVTSDQLNNISDKQWNFFLDLVEIKYGLEDKKVFTQILGNKFDDNDRKKLVNLISDFSQIHALSKAAMDENHPSFTLAWNKMIDLLKYVDPDYDVLNNAFNSKQYPEIDQLQSLYKIGQQISKKDFKAATKSTLEFVKPLYTNFNFNIEVNENKFLITNKTYSKCLEVLDINKFKKSNFQLENFTISFDNNNSKLIIVGDKDLKTFSLQDIKNEIKNLQISIDNDVFLSDGKSNLDVLSNLYCLKKDSNSYKISFSESLILSNFFKPIKIDKNKIKTEEINKQISNSLLLANLIVDLADNPLKVLNNNNYEIFNIELEDIQDNLQNKSVNKLIKTSMLFTDIFNARDEKGVYNAIEEMFSPKESYMIKRKNKRTLTVNGYVGLFGGYQFVQSQPSDYKNSFIYGITAPIGVTYSGKSFGVFMQLLEIGNVVNHYLWSNADYSQSQKLTLKEFFSPGFKLLYNIRKTPFVAFVGTSLVQVDKRYNDNLEIINNKSIDLIQISAGVKVDIPFFTISKSNRSKNK